MFIRYANVRGITTCYIQMENGVGEKLNMTMPDKSVENLDSLVLADLYFWRWELDWLIMCLPGGQFICVLEILARVCV